MSWDFLNPHVSLKSDLFVDVNLINRLIEPLLTQNRVEKISRVLENRISQVAVVLEGIYDRGNISAVMRTAEALGFINFHVIETQEKFKEANRVTQGADKWVEVKKWKSTRECILELKNKGLKIIVTSLDQARPIEEVDCTVPLAFVLGNEKEGVSSEMLELADEKVFLPMTGFVQSYNLSVAGAIGLYQIWSKRKNKWGNPSDLSDQERSALRARYYLRTQESAEDVLARYLLGQNQS